jgi:hypothetical protein
LRKADNVRVPARDCQYKNLMGPIITTGVPIFDSAASLQRPRTSTRSRKKYERPHGLELAERADLEIELGELRLVIVPRVGGGELGLGEI